MRPVLGDALSGPEHHHRAVRLLEILADILRGDPYDSYSNYIRRFLIDLTQAGYGTSWMLETRDLFLEYLAQSAANIYGSDDDDAAENLSLEIRDALRDFAEGEIGYYIMRDMAIVAESHIDEAIAGRDASRKEREMLLRVTTKLHTALSRRDIFAGLLELLCELTPPAQAAAILTFNKSGNLTLSEVYSLDDFLPVKSEINLNGTIYHDILQHGEERILDRSRISQSVDLVFHRLSTVGEKVLRVPPLSVAVVPVFAEKICIGGLAFFNFTREGSFGANDLALLGVVTHQLGIALERVLYSEKAARQHRRIRAVLDIAETLKPGQTPREVAENILGKVRGAIEFTRGAIFHLDDRGEIMPTGVIDIEAPLDLRQIDFPEESEQLLVLALQRNEIIHIEDLSSHDELPCVELPSPVKGVTEGALIIAPMSIDEYPVGVLLMYSREAHAFDNVELDLMKVICQQAAHFLTRSLDYERHVKNRAALDEERRLASVLQKNLSPKSFRKEPWEVQVSLFAGDAIGGDFTLVKPSDDGLMAGLGDVSGRGHAAALMMLHTYGLIKGAWDDTSEPADALRRVNEILCAHYGSLPGRFAPGGFATCSIVSATCKKEIKLSGAGSPPVFLYRHNTGDVFAIELSGIPLGINPGAEYATQSLGLAQGDKLLLYSGGLVSSEDAAGEPFGIDELNALFTRSARFPARVILDIIDGVLPYSAGDRDLDDRTAIVLALDHPGMKRLSFKGSDEERESASNMVMKAVKRRTDNRDVAFATRLALHEIVKNAVEHGNRGDESLDVHLAYLVGEDFIHIAIRDSGKGFDPGLLRRGIGSAGILRDKGRGLMMVKQLMQRVWYDPAAGEMNLFTRFPGSED